MHSSVAVGHCHYLMQFQVAATEHDRGLQSQDGAIATNLNSTVGSRVPSSRTICLAMPM